MKPARSLRALGAMCALLFAGFTAGCKSKPQPKPLEQLTAQENAGHTLFARNCSLCHNDRIDEPLHGPALIGLYKKPYLPSGAPANDERISNTVLHGRNNMPAFGNTLTADDINDLLAYLKTL